MGLFGTGCTIECKIIIYSSIITVSGLIKLKVVCIKIIARGWASAIHKVECLL